ncbi:MAG: hypothetical protein KF757_10370 [Phycisphaeraceae bacterium]|nr:hypothetical protein [Phycisphaeraceae bacterium]MCW5764115.1 hypothetical protein [Phycisphaeraceae bacterium]
MTFIAHFSISPRRLGALAKCAVGLLTLLAVPGCMVGTLVGGMAASAKRHGDHMVYTDYEGLSNKSFAAVVVADRVIEAEYAGLTATMMQRINNMIAEAHAQLPDGAIAAPNVDRMLRVLYANPRWVAMPRQDVAKMLGVDRLIVVDLAVYRLHEPGNVHIWDGVAAGTVSVFEADGPMPDDAVYEKAITVTFPDGRGFMTTDLRFDVVNTELSRRFSNRVAWLFFDHKEPNEIKY